MRLEMETNRFYLGRDYSEALAAAGASPVHLSLIPDPDYINDVMDGLDGVLLPGSDTDVDPAYYGEDPHPAIGKIVPEKDETDILVLKAAERLGLPVFAICFGMQSLNVSRGGSLIQDIASQVPNSIEHQQGIPRPGNSHLIVFENDSLIAKHADEAVRHKVKVNSHHHQAISKTGKDLRVTAWTSDGVIEAIEDTRTGRFVLGVQWHPELSWKNDRLSGGLFRDFIDACARQTGSEET